ncbi:MAG: dNTP triphosphohydrolase [Verrucomicrobiales bacterium]|nr:dNTP triphosphohydrolase [Verrucomicrobiales bacterium]
MPDNQFYSAFDLETLEPHRSREGEYRSIFQINRDRIIHTSAFRRLQSKTQVFLSGEYDFYRTRLTHSIEVSQIGRSICESLRRRSPLLAEDFFIDPDLVEAACLAHDIGHPPFGHAGERTLHRLLLPWGGFEGNAQTLRLLTETIFTGRRQGMNPCRALLDGVLKYKTLFSELAAPENHFLYDAQDRYLDFVLGGNAIPPELPPGRHRDSFRSIECQIMDWADDTAYSLNDIADGINAGFITPERVEHWAEAQQLSGSDAENVRSLLEGMRRGGGRAEARLRRKIGDAIDAATLEPDANFMSELSNRYRFRLGITEEAREEARLYKRMALHLVFRSRQLQQLEYKADFILTRLFEAFCGRYLQDPPVHRLHLLSETDEAALAAAPDAESTARLLCDALSRMTDGFAARTYKRLFEADFGSIVDLV